MSPTPGGYPLGSRPLSPRRGGGGCGFFLGGGLGLGLGVGFGLGAGGGVFRAALGVPPGVLLGGFCGGGGGLGSFGGVFPPLLLLLVVLLLLVRLLLLLLLPTSFPTLTHPVCRGPPPDDLAPV